MQAHPQQASCAFSPHPPTPPPVPNHLRWVHMTCSCLEFTRPEMAGVSLPHHYDHVDDSCPWATAPGLGMKCRAQVSRTDTCQADCVPQIHVLEPSPQDLR